MSPAGFLEWAENRRKKSIVVRQEISDEKKREVLELWEQGLSKKAIAIVLDMSYKQVKRYFI